ncbi:MAG: hypothetical protein JSW51_12915 [Gemmatimonadota bacterium]|nr:MAG: hypothetical protein JSW51_12915 [Gemmatimonadota bacterium]
MPMTYQIDPQRRLVTAIASGRLESADAIAVFDEVMSHPDFGTGMRLLSDHRQLESVLPTEFVKAMVRRIEDHPDMFQNSRWAFIESGMARYGMARMASILLERSPVKLRVFRNIERARRWLLAEDTD